MLLDRCDDFQLEHFLAVGPRLGLLLVNHLEESFKYFTSVAAPLIRAEPPGQNIFMRNVIVHKFCPLLQRLRNLFILLGFIYMLFLTFTVC